MSSTSQVPDPEVPATTRTRRWSAAYKARILAEYEACDKAGRGALLRREGLYTSFVDKAPATIYHELLDEGSYVASVSSMYRILRAYGEVKERRRQAVHPARVKPELVATQPNQIWSWDIERHEAPRTEWR